MAAAQQEQQGGQTDVFIPNPDALAARLIGYLQDDDEDGSESADNMSMPMSGSSSNNFPLMSSTVSRYTETSRVMSVDLSAAFPVSNIPVGDTRKLVQARLAGELSAAAIQSARRREEEAAMIRDANGGTMNVLDLGGRIGDPPTRRPKPTEQQAMEQQAMEQQSSDTNDDVELAQTAQEQVEQPPAIDEASQQPTTALPDVEYNPSASSSSSSSSAAATTAATAAATAVAEFAESQGEPVATDGSVKEDGDSASSRAADTNSSVVALGQEAEEEQEHADDGQATTQPEAPGREPALGEHAGTGGVAQRDDEVAVGDGTEVVDGSSSPRQGRKRGWIGWLLACCAPPPPPPPPASHVAAAAASASKEKEEEAEVHGRQGSRAADASQHGDCAAPSTTSSSSSRTTGQRRGDDEGVKEQHKQEEDEHNNDNHTSNSSSSSHGASAAEAAPDDDDAGGDDDSIEPRPATHNAPSSKPSASSASSSTVSHASSASASSAAVPTTTLQSSSRTVTTTATGQTATSTPAGGHHGKRQVQAEGSLLVDDSHANKACINE